MRIGIDLGGTKIEGVALDDAGKVLESHRIAIASYLGRGSAFDRAVADFAEAYAGQNERDHAALDDAVRSGRVAAERGV